MAHGGPCPTPTDALFVLGQVKNGDRERAAAGMADIATGLGLPLRDAAQAVFDKACEAIMENATDMITQANRKPVYTVHEFLKGHLVNPRRLLMLGGAARHFATRIAEISPYSTELVPNWRVANAIGAAIARTTCEVSLYADTRQGSIAAPGENFYADISADFNREKALGIAFDLLKKKARRIGAHDEDLEMDVLEAQQFNMVRGFSTIGKSIRIKVQIKPGLISGYAPGAALR